MMSKNAKRLVWLSWSNMVLKLMGRFLHAEMLSCLLCGVGCMVRRSRCGREKNQLTQVYQRRD